MHCKEILSPNATVKAEIITEEVIFYGARETHYGIKVSLLSKGELVCHTYIPSVSGNISYVDSLATAIINQRISPAAAPEFIEKELSK